MDEKNWSKKRHIMVIIQVEGKEDAPKNAS